MMINWARVGDNWNFPDLCFTVSVRRITADSMAKCFLLMGICFDLKGEKIIKHIQWKET